MEAPKRILDYLKILEVLTGEEAYAAGGAARDLFHGQEPKDYDIFIPKLTNNPGKVYSCMRGSGLSVPVFEPVYGEGGRDEKYLGVIRQMVTDHMGIGFVQDGRGNMVREPMPPEGRVRYKLYDIDIVFRDLEVETIEEVVADFDANFNLYWFGSDGVIHWLEDAVHTKGEIEIYDSSNRSPEYYRRVIKKLGVYNV